MRERELSILFFINSLSLGGAERVTANLANFWSKKGWEVIVISLASDSIDFYQLDPSIRRISLNLNTESFNLLLAFKNNIRRILFLRRELMRFKPDIALSIMTTANILLTLAKIGLKNIVAVGSERTYPSQQTISWVWRVMRRYLYSRLSAIVSLTHESAFWLKKYTNSKKIVVIPNSVVFPLPLQKPIIKISPKFKKQKILLSVGRLSEEKQFDILISVFQKLIFDFPDWVLVILGEGNIRYQLEKQIKSLKMENHVFLPGNTGNIGEWYASADIYVLTSRYEGFPNSLVEAMAHGLPAISFDCDTGPRDIIRNGIDGLLVSEMNIDELSKALRQLMDDDILRNKFAEMAIEVRERFSLEKVAKMWEELFMNILYEKK